MAYEQDITRFHLFNMLQMTYEQDITRFHIVNMLQMANEQDIRAISSHTATFSDLYLTVTAEPRNGRRLQVCNTLPPPEPATCAA